MTPDHLLQGLPFVRSAFFFGLVWMLAHNVHAEVDLSVTSWRDDFKSIEAWTSQTSWLPNASDTAKVSTDGDVACFAVDEPGKGMKWSRGISPVWLPEAKYLVMRYRADRVNPASGGYFVYLNDGGKQECNAFRMSDVVSDGKWHTVAVDAQSVAQGESVDAIALQVQATAEGEARLWLDFLEFTPDLPRDATEIQRQPVVAEKQPDWVADLKNSEWHPRRDWLGNAADKCEALKTDEGIVLRVNEPSRGMKWSWDMPSPVTPEGHRFMLMRYRARNARPVSDYALAVIGKARGDGMDYAAAIPPNAILSDGRWHTAAVDLREVLGKIKSVGAFALQVQAGDKAPAELVVSRIGFADAAPEPELSEFADVKAGGAFKDFAPVDLTSVCNDSFQRFLQHLKLKDWPEGASVTVEGIPFRQVKGANSAACSGMTAEGTVRIPVKTTTSEVYLLLCAAYRGKDDPVHGEGKLTALQDVDRFRVRLTYSDGSAEECLPLNVGVRRFEVSTGPQVLCAFAVPWKRLKRIEVCDSTRQGAFAVAGVTCRTSGKSDLAGFREEQPPLRIAGPKPFSARDPAITFKGGEVLLENGSLSMALNLEPLRIRQLLNRATGHRLGLTEESVTFLGLKVDGKEIGAADWRLRGEPQATRDKLGCKMELCYQVTSVPGVHVSVSLTLPPTGELGASVTVANNAVAAPLRSLELVGPRIGAIRMGKRLEDDYYLFPKRGAVFNNAQCNFRSRYCGLFPVQFVSAFSPSSNDGVYLRTEDREGINRQYALAKSEEGITLGIEYAAHKLAPGEVWKSAPTRLGVTSGDWHEALNAYRKWLKSWYRPASPRQQWFREVFNFRQRFLYWLDPLYDESTGDFSLQRALVEVQEKFGGVEYLHLFDWGNCGQYGRIYGRTGDYSPYDYMKGGKDAFKKAVTEVQQQGVRVGLYIEGYLLQETGKLGQAHGKEWQLTGSAGTGLYWPQSTEMYVCPWVPAWRDVQASTYAARVSELDVNGMYLDEYGFSGAGMDCYSEKHGHPTPGYAVLGERGCTKLVREAITRVKPGVALYSEESPCDVNSQYQDGSFTYCMNESLQTDTRVPLNLMRFAVPSFKTFEILFCDKPTGSWATGVKWVFFNGEGIWLEGPAEEWFAPQTLATIRKCHAILRQHKEAFTSDEPVPLVPTEMGGVFANLFPTKTKRVYTLYNSRHRTVSGPVLRVPHVEGAKWWDAWHGRPMSVKRDGEFDVISTTIGPMDVGCVVQELAR